MTAIREHCILEMDPSGIAIIEILSQHMEEPLQAFRVTFFRLSLRRGGYYCKR